MTFLVLQDCEHKQHANVRWGEEEWWLHVRVFTPRDHLGINSV